MSLGPSHPASQDVECDLGNPLLGTRVPKTTCRCKLSNQRDNCRTHVFSSACHMSYSNSDLAHLFFLALASCSQDTRDLQDGVRAFWTELPYTSHCPLVLMCSCTHLWSLSTSNRPNSGMALLNHQCYKSWLQVPLLDSSSNWKSAYPLQASL